MLRTRPVPALLAMALALGIAACSDTADPVVDTGIVRGEVYRHYSRLGIAGARVSCGGVVAETDAAGAYRLTGVPQRAEELIVQSEGYRDHREPLDVGEFQTVNLELVPLDTLADISGLVRHRVDGPLQARVEIGEHTVLSDIDGRYRLTGWPHGLYAIHVEHPGYVPYDTTVAVYQDGQVLSHTLLREVSTVLPVTADASIHWDDGDAPGDNHGTGLLVTVSPDPRRSVLYGFEDSVIPTGATVQSLVLRVFAHLPGNGTADPWSFSLGLQGALAPWYEDSVDAVNRPPFFAAPTSVTVQVPALADTVAMELDVTAALSPLPYGHVYGIRLDALGAQTPLVEIFAREIGEFFPELVPSYELVYRY